MAEDFQFEQSLNTLAEIVNTLESDELAVAQSVQLYEQGMTLINQCQLYLSQSKSRIEQVNKDSSDPVQLDIDNDN